MRIINDLKLFEDTYQNPNITKNIDQRFKKIDFKHKLQQGDSNQISKFI